jgi:hypothetical protein
MAAGAATGGQSPEEVADFIASIASDPNPNLRYQTTPEVTQLVGRKLADVDGASILRLTRRWLS